jgi:hypothetical protein
MTTFREQSKEFLKDLSRASAWMMRRNVGQAHWWRSGALTEKNSDTKKRPIFEQARADEIFEELKVRSLLVERSGDVDGSDVPAFTMRYDIEAWDKAVADGRPLYALWLKIRRSWLLILATFILTCLATTLENRVVGFIDGVVDRVLKTQKGEPIQPAQTTPRS